MTSHQNGRRLLSRTGAPAVLVAAIGVLWTPRASAQDLFEIQVYPYDTVAPHRTMVEIHTNFFPGREENTEREGGELSNHHQVHLTAEITHGLTPYWELAGYVVTAAYVPGRGPEFVGARIRPRFRIPETGRLPFKFSLSTELAFTRQEFEANNITLELRPILEKETGRWYFSLNPDVTKSFRGEAAHQGPEFEPGLKIAYHATKVVAAGIEYYAATGRITHFEALRDQHHVLIATTDFDVSPDWELNFGVGRGLTATSERWVVKGIAGYRFHF